MKNINIIYLLPELKGATGGAKVIYKHSSILNKLNKNLSSSVIHLKKKFSYKLETSLSKRIKYFDTQEGGWNAKQMKISESFLPDKNWFNKKINLGKNLNFNKKTDFIIIPEIWSHFAEDLNLFKRKIKYAIFVQGFYHMNSTTNYSKLKKSYENAEIIITNSEYSLSYLKDLFPKQINKIIKIDFSLDCKKFKIQKKLNLITYMPRKLPDHSNLLKFYLRGLLPKGWKIVPLQNISQAQLVNTLSKSKIFLSFSNLEGIGLPPIEAALSGNKVIGYVGGGGSEFWKKPLFTKVENGEIRDFGKKTLLWIYKYNNNWIKKTKKHRKDLERQYSEKNEILSLMKLSNKIINFF